MTTPVTIPMRRRTACEVPDARTVSGLSIGDYLIRRLRDYGVRDIKMPATPYNVWKAIQNAKTQDG